jgi:hypothetical protein
MYIAAVNMLLLRGEVLLSVDAIDLRDLEKEMTDEVGGIEGNNRRRNLVVRDFS